ncbi:MAG: UDP-2,3-diacylglucosamine diphosphatase LpxI [Chthoniobacterales bacterium]
MKTPDSIVIIAGSGRYPLLLAQCARAAGVKKIYAAAFERETDREIEKLADSVTWMRVGQMGKLLTCLKDSGAKHTVMAGQIAPNNLFDLRPDLKALMMLAKIPKRNAESLFGAIAKAIEEIGLEVLPATTFLDEHVASEGPIAGPKLKPRELEDIQYGHSIAKEVSRLDIGQTVVVKNGTVLAVEAFEGTNEAILRGGALGRGGATMVKVSKPNQDLRFDVPVIGPATLKKAAEAKLRTIAVEAGKTIILDREETAAMAVKSGITIFGVKS